MPSPAGQGTVSRHAETDKEGHKSVTAGKKTVLVDTVKYKNLDTEKWYRFKGTLVLKSTGDPLVEHGKKVTAYSRKFKPKTSDGSVNVIFKLDTRKYAGKEVVAYEVAYELDGDKKTRIAEHKDLNDEAQTVRIEKAEEPEPEPEKPESPTRSSGPKTGDNNKIGFLIGLLCTSLAALIALIRKKFHKPIK